MIQQAYAPIITYYNHVESHPWVSFRMAFNNLNGDGQLRIGPGLQLPLEIRQNLQLALFFGAAAGIDGGLQGITGRKTRLLQTEKGSIIPGQRWWTQQEIPEKAQESKQKLPKIAKEPGVEV